LKEADLISLVQHKGFAVVSTRRTAGRRAVQLAITAVAGVFSHAASVPEPRRTRSGCNLEAREAASVLEVQGGAAKVLFVVIRTRALAMFLGMPTTVDALYFPR
jgi:hypothetical protein